MSRIVENNEPDTLCYQFYLNRSETMCLVHETYTNSDSTLTHIHAITSKTILLKIFNISKLNRLDFMFVISFLRVTLNCNIFLLSDP
jgi:hypothetical protein